MEWTTKASWRNLDWKYVNAAATDVSRTFDRVRREMGLPEVKRTYDDSCEDRASKENNKRAKKAN